MPLIRVTSSGRALDDDQRRDLAGVLTDVLLQIEGGTGLARARALAYVLFEHLPDGSWAVGGSVGNEHFDAPTRLMARVEVPAGALDRDGKERAISATYEALTSVVPGSVVTEGWAPWVIVTEVPDGNWGGSGQPRSLADIAEHAGVPESVVELLRSTTVTQKA
jgi:phenylpyruvate tautomerase PptA (4-oxalocrotonate tautomerase family)